MRPMSLRTLNWYNDDRGITPSFIVDTLGHLPNLKRIDVTETFRGPFIDALMHKSNDYNSSPAALSSVVFPRLHTLELRHGLRAEVIQVLQDCLIERRERNAPIKVLTVRPNIDVVNSKGLTLLRELVVDLKINY